MTEKPPLFSASKEEIDSWYFGGRFAVFRHYLDTFNFRLYWTIDKPEEKFRYGYNFTEHFASFCIDYSAPSDSKLFFKIIFNQTATPRRGKPDKINVGDPVDQYAAKIVILNLINLIELGRSSL